MFLGVQLLGLVFVAVMVYFTYLNYKRHNYGSRSFISWLVVWLFAGLFVLLPSSIYNFMGFLSIDRTQDFFFIGAFVVLFVIVFNMYVTIKKTNAKVEEFVSLDALKNPVKKRKK
ncbi:DUF2304 domain-containing protein [Candidatus Woesearchaeota archaeon]|nr:DUF2304 domain-containing protein [Candidatus Woesearchaeota archaeon]